MSVKKKSSYIVWYIAIVNYKKIFLKKLNLIVNYIKKEADLLKETHGFIISVIYRK